MTVGIDPVEQGLVHDIPADMLAVLSSSELLKAKWNALTAIQRNEWICWVTIVKKPETRHAHLLQWVEELNKGKKKPCCWPGCPHRRPSAAKWFHPSKLT